MTPAEVARGGYGPNGKPGTGGPGYSIKGEWKTNPHNEHKDGTLAMARSSMPDSQAASSTSALAPSRSSTVTTPCSATRSRASTSSPNSAPAASSRKHHDRERQRLARHCTALGVDRRNHTMNAAVFKQAQEAYAQGD